MAPPLKVVELTAESATGRSFPMRRRESMAVLVLMATLAMAPSLVLAAQVCAPDCCPGLTERAATADCGPVFASRTCCGEAEADRAPRSPASAHASVELPTGPALAPTPPALASERERLAPPGAEAERALRTSPLRLSVVLLI